MVKRQQRLYKIKVSRDPVAIAQRLNLPYYKNTPAANALIQLAPNNPGVEAIWNAVIDAGLFPYNARKGKKNTSDSEYAKIRNKLHSKLKNVRVPIEVVSKLAAKVNRGRMTLEEAVKKAKE